MIAEEGGEREKRDGVRVEKDRTSGIKIRSKIMKRIKSMSTRRIGFDACYS
jgi:hypothetical protein